MPLPPWILNRSAPAELEKYNVTANLAVFDKKSIYLTDARRVGVMLRDGRLTLRNHSALTRFVVESISDQDIVLHAPAAGNKAYVQVSHKGAFFANASREQAQSFQLQVTELGIELYLAGQRPAVFDDFYDVSIGKWQTGLSAIPSLVHDDLSKIWIAPNGGGGSQEGNGEGVP